MEIERLALPLAAYTLAQEILIELIAGGLFTKEQSNALLNRAITRLQPDSALANSQASIFLGEIRDAL